MFVNLSNHPSEHWDTRQRNAALALAGPIVDLPFPEVPPDADERTVTELADRVTDSVPATATHAMVMGEFTLTVALISRLCRRGIRCLAATTRRQAADLPDGRKAVRFEFVRFREYEPPVSDHGPAERRSAPGEE
jgi:hypothetical protein